MAGLLGWAFGGFTFGIIADYIGRVRTLALSILIFSVFTALQGFAQTPFAARLLPLFRRGRHRRRDHRRHPVVAEAFAENEPRQASSAS